MKYTTEDINKWKATHGDLFEISVEGKSCVLHKPTRQDLSYASVIKDPIKMSEVMLKQLWVAGDEEIKTNDESRHTVRELQQQGKHTELFFSKYLERNQA